MYVNTVVRQRKLSGLVLIVVFIVQVTEIETTDLEDSSQGNHLIVQTNSGPVEGTTVTGFSNKEVHAFYGIPYAEPPIGDLRFKPPQPINPWTEVLKATKQPLPCYQSYNAAFGVVGDEKRLSRPWTEDCLKLNIWVPKPTNEGAPVLTVFHPGYFQRGSNTYPDGRTICAEAEGIVVSMNYRLGAFGFLYLGVPGAPGNVGLLDQQLALKWIHENIHNFGGKTQAVLLVGAGDAGAASVGYHLLSPGSKDFFSTVTALSGSPTCNWAFHDQDTSLKEALSLSKYLGCPKGNIEEELECLRRAHPEDIVDAHSSDSGYHSLQFKPTVDGTFIMDPPLEALKNGHFKKTFLLSISNTEEGSIPLWEHNFDHIPDPGNGMDNAGFKKAVKRIHPMLSEAEMGIVEDFYIDKCASNDPYRIRDAAIRVYSDLLIDCCMSIMNEHYADKGGLVVRAVEDFRRKSDPSWIGSSHAMTVRYSFGYPYYDEGFGEAERNFTTIAFQILKDIVHKKASEFMKVFPKFERVNRTYVFYEISGPKIFSHYRKDHCKLWNDIIPAFDKLDQTCETV